MSAELAMRLLSLGRGGRLRSVLQVVGNVLILAVLAYVLYQNRDQFQSVSFSPDYPMAALAFALWVGAYLLFALGWSLVLRALGNPIGWWKASRVFFLSQGLKYIPGSVVYAFGRVYMAQEAGVRAVPAAIGFALESFLALGTAMLVFLALLPLGLWQDLPALLIVGALVGVVAILVSLPLVLGRLSAFWAKAGAVDLSYLMLALLSGFYIIIWLVVGAACFVSLKSLGPGFNLGYLQVLGLYAVSWAAGLVAVFAPGGVGVRDGLLVLLLSQFVPLPLAAMGAAVLRIQTLFVEGVLAFVALKLQR
ncbi:MAG: lysylphosphatidylglycerol synthase domain-containing protein [Dehalococcoidia bacterium]|nr:lysylphosphatidylglycerol synthase domain-containing protein [Dehalococcoidia bacterium]